MRQSQSEKYNWEEKNINEWKIERDSLIEMECRKKKTKHQEDEVEKKNTEHFVCFCHDKPTANAKSFFHKQQEILFFQYNAIQRRYNIPFRSCVIKQQPS